MNTTVYYADAASEDRHIGRRTHNDEKPRCPTMIASTYVHLLATVDVVRVICQGTGAWDRIVGRFS